MTVIQKIVNLVEESALQLEEYEEKSIYQLYSLNTKRCILLISGMVALLMPFSETVYLPSLHTLPKIFMLLTPMWLPRCPHISLELVADS